MKLLNRAPRIENLENSSRLAVIQNEPPLREKLPDENHLKAILYAREYLFQNTPQISRLTNSRKRV